MILNGCFSHFLSFTNSTKSCKASQITLKYLEYHREHTNIESGALELMSYNTTLRIDDIKFHLAFSESVLYPGMEGYVH